MLYNRPVPLSEKAVRAAMGEHHRRNGKRLQARRSELGLRQHQLAEMTGLTQAAISLYEVGLREPRDHHRVIIAAALACAVDDIWQAPDRVEIATLVRDVVKGDAA